MSRKHFIDLANLIIEMNSKFPNCTNLLKKLIIEICKKNSRTFKVKEFNKYIEKRIWKYK